MDRATRVKYEFRWDVLDIIVGGKSSIDSSQGFAIRSADEAKRFIESYGYDVDRPIEQAELIGNFHEALNFIRKHFLAPENPNGIKSEIPRKITEITQVQDLLLMASMSYPDQTSDTPGRMLRDWACSILKLMHTIAHIDKDVRTSYVSDIQQQIFDRYYKVIQRDDDQRLYLGDRPDDPMRVNLVAFETKPKKSRNSIILKLLHKPENVAEELFDRIGVRIITETPFDCLQVIKFLKERMLVMPPNIKPSRSRNTLIDLDYFRGELDAILAKVDDGEITSEADLLRHLDPAARYLPKDTEEGASTVTGGENPHSSDFYRAIQFTCRQLIKQSNPLYTELKELKAEAKKTAAARAGDGLTSLLERLDRIDLKYIQKEVRFFYPYEVQLLDQKSAKENELGRSAHSEYKKAQLQTAMKRVMGPLA